MGNGAHQTVGPVVAAERHLFPGRELQAAVCAEVNHRVGSEAVLRPEVGADVGVGRSGFGAVYDGESVVADRSHGLRQQHDVAQIDAGYGQARLALPDRTHIAARRFAVQLHDVGIELFGQGVLHPGFVFRLSDQCRTAVFQEVVESSFGIGAQYGTLRHQQLFELFFGRRQVFHRVAFGLEPFQKIIERRHRFQSLGRQRGLSGAFEVVDRYFLFSIRLPFQRDEVADDPGEILQPFGNGLEEVDSLFVQFLIVQHVGVDRAVQFGYDDTLGHESPEHPHRVAFPLLLRFQHGERREDRDVPLLQPLHGCVGLAHDHAPMREVDDRVGADFPQERQTLAVRRNGIDVHSCVLQRYDQAVDVGPVAAEGVVQTAYDCDFRGFLPINSLFPEVFLIICHRLE